MKFSLAATLAIAGIASAAPGYPSYPYSYGNPNSQPQAAPTPAPSNGKPAGPPSYGPPVECLNDKSAKALVDGFVSLITNYNAATADALLAKDFTDTSDSINVMTGTPLGSATFPSKEAFKAGQGSQPQVPMTVLSIDEVTCTNVAFRWQATPNPQYPDLKVKGINSFVASNANKTEAGWQIKTMYSEFNNCVWIKAIGGTCKMPGA